MIKLNLTANGNAEERILDYLQNNVSDTLAEKINNGTQFEKDGKPLLNKKTLVGFMKYASDEARKLADKNATSACVDDETVFSWAIHYFEEDSIEGTLYTIDGEEYKPIVKTSKPTSVSPKKIEPAKPQNVQFSFFDKLEETGKPNSGNEEPTSDTETDDDDGDEEFTEEEKNEILQEVALEEYNERHKVEQQTTEPQVKQFYKDYQLYQSEHPTAVVALRLGDFYEIFGAYAIVVSTEIGLTLTSRDVGLSRRVEMVGFPYHASENYFAKIAKLHDLYIVENERDTQFIQRVSYVDNRHIDEDTGEILTEEEMREFDGDIEEPQELFEDEMDSTPSNDNAVLKILQQIFGNNLAEV